jgi:hypothetical protein
VDRFPPESFIPNLHRPSSMVQSIPQVSSASKWHINTKERVFQRARRPHAGVFLGCFLVLNSSLPRLPTHHRSLFFVSEALYTLLHTMHTYGLMLLSQNARVILFIRTLGLHLSNTIFLHIRSRILWTGAECF